LKPKIYIETSIVSYLTSEPSNDIRVAANQQVTREWWNDKRFQYNLFISEFVVAEVSLGDQQEAKKRVTVIKEISQLKATEDVWGLGKKFMDDGPIPAKAEIDAYHIAVATVNGIEYLLTWNCSHIANAVMRPKIEAICREQNFEPPIICTPQELLEG
jgi:hypothetical protein